MNTLSLCFTEINCTVFWDKTLSIWRTGRPANILEESAFSVLIIKLPHSQHRFCLEQRRGYSEQMGSMCYTRGCHNPVAYPGIFFGGFQQIQLSTEGREMGIWGQ
jgi:hypothetical protein